MRKPRGGVYGGMRRRRANRARFSPTSHKQVAVTRAPVNFHGDPTASLLDIPALSLSLSLRYPQPHTDMPPLRHELRRCTCCISAAALSLNALSIFFIIALLPPLPSPSFAIYTIDHLLAHRDFFPRGDYASYRSLRVVSAYVFGEPDDGVRATMCQRGRDEGERKGEGQATSIFFFIGWKFRNRASKGSRSIKDGRREAKRDGRVDGWVI